MSQFTAGEMSDYGSQAPVTGPERTSVMAILSLVCSLICCIPGLGAIGALFGVGGLIGIKSSNGRVGGTGLAITGIILGMLATLLWIVGVIAMSQAMALPGQMVKGPLEPIAARDVAEFRAYLDPQFGATVSDAEIVSFMDAVDDKMGALVGPPESLMALMGAFMEVGEIYQQIQPPGQPQPQNVIPWPVEFDGGWAVVSIEFGPDPTGVTLKGVVISIGVITKDGTEIWLVDPAGGGAVAPAPGTTP